MGIPRPRPMQDASGLPREFWIQRFAVSLRMERPKVDHAHAVQFAQTLWPSLRMLEPQQAVLHLLLLLDDAGAELTEL